MREDEIFKKSVELWGEGAQMAMLAEESAELSVAALHMLRAKKENAYAHLSEEIADVEFMIAEMKGIFPNLQKDVSYYRALKRERLEKLINSESGQVSGTRKRNGALIMSESEARTFLNDVKVAFMMYNPFFYFLLNNMEVVYIDEVSEQRDDSGKVIAKTPLAVDGMRLFIYRNALEDGIVKAHPISTIKHELVHIALNHCCRGADIIRHEAMKHNLVLTNENIEKVRFLVNLAMDAKDNYMLKLDGDNVSWGFTGEGFWSKEDVEKCSVEELVEKIFDENIKERVKGFGAGIDILRFAGEGEDGCKGKVLQDGEGCFKGLYGKELEAKLSQKIGEAIVKSKLAGVEKGGFLRKMEEDYLLPKQQAWWLQLRNLMRSEIIKSKVSDWRIINRKLPNQIAGLRVMKKPKGVCFVDVSGSIGEREYNLFMGEMLLASKEADITGVFWDGGIQEIRQIRSKKDVLKHVIGGGGTTFAPVIEGFKFSGYDFMVCLTDGEWYDTSKAVGILNKIHNVYKILCTSATSVDGFDRTIKMIME